MRARWRPVFHALRVSGVPIHRLLGLVFPVGRIRRIEAALRWRSSVLTAKNDTVDYLFRAQARLAKLHLSDLASVQAALKEPEKRRLILTFGISREMLESELAEKYQSDTTTALDEALSELTAEGVVLRVPAKWLVTQGEAARRPLSRLPESAASDVLLAIHARRHAGYDASEIGRLMREGRDYGREMESRREREADTERGRTYQL